jgi:ATP-dependent DNA ligase
MAKSARATPTGTIPTRRRAELASPPAWIKPQLAKLVEKAPDGPNWLHEIKFDGYRMHARLDSGRAQILTRRGNDWTDKYSAIDTGMPVAELERLWRRLQPLVIEKMPLAESPPEAIGSVRRWCFHECIGSARKWS